MVTRWASGAKRGPETGRTRLADSRKMAYLQMRQTVSRSVDVGYRERF